MVIATLLQSCAAASCADGASGLAFAAPAFAGVSGAGDDVAGAAVATAAVTSGAGGATADADIATDCVGVATASVLGAGDVRGDARCETAAACPNLAGVADAGGTPLAASRRRLHQVQENSLVKENKKCVLCVRCVFVGCWVSCLNMSRSILGLPQQQSLPLYDHFVLQGRCSQGTWHTPRTDGVVRTEEHT